MGGVFDQLSGAAGLRAEGKSAQNIANFNAAVAEQEGEAAKIKAGFEQQRQAKRGEAIKSTLVAKLGTAGGLDSPVALDIIGEQAEELELENLLIGFEGEVAARRAGNQAEIDRLQGRLAKQKGKNAARRANIQFGTQLAILGGTFLTGFGGSTAGAGKVGSGGSLPLPGGPTFA